MKFTLFIAMLFLLSCKEHIEYVTCESPYYSGPAKSVYIGKQGTCIMLQNGKTFYYSPGIKCAVED